jgi:hypothetical protein
MRFSLIHLFLNDVGAEVGWHWNPLILKEEKWLTQDDAPMRGRADCADHVAAGLAKFAPGVTPDCQRRQPSESPRCELVGIVRRTHH